MKRFFGVVITMVLVFALATATCAHAEDDCYECDHYWANPDIFEIEFTNCWTGSIDEFETVFDNEGVEDFFNYNGMSYDELGEIAIIHTLDVTTCGSCGHEHAWIIYDIQGNYYLIMAYR